jgi:hypothetical protein
VLHRWRREEGAGWRLIATAAAEAHTRPLHVASPPRMPRVQFTVSSPVRCPPPPGVRRSRASALAVLSRLTTLAVEALHPPGYSSA